MEKYDNYSALEEQGEEGRAHGLNADQDGEVEKVGSKDYASKRGYQKKHHNMNENAWFFSLVLSK